MNIALTGSTGLIGSRIVELLKDNFTFLPLTHENVDITNKDSVNNAVRNIDFDLLLHVAAYTSVDNAEKERQLAWNMNVDGTKNLFEITVEKNKKFIYISTDFVFDGKNPPYFEESKPYPLGVYGQTKYEGEKVVEGKGMIVRLSYPYRKSFDKKKDFVRSLKSLLEQGKELHMITDSLFVPTFIDDIAMGLKHLMQNFSPTIYHLVGSQCLSPYDAALMIAETFKLDKSLVNKTTYEEFSKNKALRPQYSDVRSKKNDFFKMKSFEEGLLNLVSARQT